MNKFKFGFFALVFAAMFSGSAFAQCMMSEHTDGQKKECQINTEAKKCTMKKDKKNCESGCQESCCKYQNAKTNFGPKKRS